MESLTASACAIRKVHAGAATGEPIDGQFQVSIADPTVAR